MSFLLKSNEEPILSAIAVNNGLRELSSVGFLVGKTTGTKTPTTNSQISKDLKCNLLRIEGIESQDGAELDAELVRKYGEVTAQKLRDSYSQDLFGNCLSPLRFPLSGVGQYITGAMNSNCKRNVTIKKQGNDVIAIAEAEGFPVINPADPNMETNILTIPGKVTNFYKLTDQGFKLEETSISNSLLKDLFLGTKQTSVTQAEVDTTQREEDAKAALLRNFKELRGCTLGFYKRMQSFYTAALQIQNDFPNDFKPALGQYLAVLKELVSKSEKLFGNEKLFELNFAGSIDTGELNRRMLRLSEILQSEEYATLLNFLGGEYFRVANSFFTIEERIEQNPVLRNKIQQTFCDHKLSPANTEFTSGDNRTNLLRYISTFADLVRTPFYIPQGSFYFGPYQTINSFRALIEAGKKTSINKEELQNFYDTRKNYPVKQYQSLQEYWETTYEMYTRIFDLFNIFQELDALQKAGTLLLTAQEKNECSCYLNFYGELEKATKAFFGTRKVIDPNFADINAEVAKISQNTKDFFDQHHTLIKQNAAYSFKLSSFTKKLETNPSLREILERHRAFSSTRILENGVTENGKPCFFDKMGKVSTVLVSRFSDLHKEVLKHAGQKTGQDTVLQHINKVSSATLDIQNFTTNADKELIVKLSGYLPGYLRAFLLAKNPSPANGEKLNIELITQDCWRAISAKYEAIEEILSHGLSGDKLLATLFKLGVDFTGLNNGGPAKIGTQLKSFYYLDQIENPVLREFIAYHNIVISRANKILDISTLGWIEKINDAISGSVSDTDFAKLLNAIGVSGFTPQELASFQAENRKINRIEVASTVPSGAIIKTPAARQEEIFNSTLPKYLVDWLRSSTSIQDGAPLNLSKLSDANLTKLLDHSIDIYKLFGVSFPSRKISAKLRELGIIGLSEKDVREIKEFRYLNQLINGTLRQYIKTKYSKVKSYGESTTKVIWQLNEAARKPISDEEFNGLLQKLGLGKIDDKSFLAIKAENLYLQEKPAILSQVLIQEALLKLEFNNTYEQDGYIFIKQKTSSVTDTGISSYYVIHKNELLGKGAFGAVVHAYPLILQPGSKKWEEDKTKAWVAKIFQDRKSYSPEEAKIVGQYYNTRPPLQHDAQTIFLMEKLPGEVFRVRAQDINIIRQDAVTHLYDVGKFKKGKVNVVLDEEKGWGIWREDTCSLIFVDNQPYPVAENELQKIGLLGEQLNKAISNESLSIDRNILRNLAMKVADYYQSDYIMHPRLGELTFAERTELATHLLQSLNSLHHYDVTHTFKPIVHGDLKGSNIRISIEDGSVSPPYGSARKISAAIIDFGASTALSNESERVTLNSARGTPSINMPPEMMAGTHEIGTKSDVWALAPILLRIFAATNPYDSANLKVGEGATFNYNYLTQFNKKGFLEGITGGMPRFPFNVKEWVGKFIDRMADPEYGKRASTDEALCFFTSLNQLCHLPQPPINEQDIASCNLYGIQMALLAYGLWNKTAIFSGRGVENCLNSKYDFISNPKACQEIINLITVGRLNEESVRVVIGLTQSGHSTKEEAKVQFDNAKQQKEYVKLNGVDWQTTLAEPIAQLLTALHEGRFKAAFEIKEGMARIIAQIKGIDVREIGADDIFSFLPSVLALSNCDLQEHTYLAGALLNKMTGKWKDGRDEHGAVSLLSVLHAGLALQKTIKYFADFGVHPNPKESVALQFTKTFEIVQNGISQQTIDVSQLSSQQKILLQDGINDYLGNHDQLSDNQAQTLTKVVFGYKDYFPKIKAVHEKGWQEAFFGFKLRVELPTTNAKNLDDLLVDVRCKILDRRSFVITNVPNFGAVRVFPPRKAQVELDYADVFGRGLDLARAVLTILKNHYHKDQARLNVSVHKLKELLLKFRTLIEKSQNDVKASVKNFQQFNSALISLVSDEERIFKNHGVAKKAIDQIRDFLWKATWQNEANCIVSENPIESGQKVGFALQFARPVTISPSASDPNSPWHKHAEQGWYKSLSSKYGPWFDRFFNANVGVLQTLATTSMMRNIPNPANAYHVRTILTNKEGNISSINRGYIHAAMTEAYEVKNPVERSRIATWNRCVLLEQQEREAIVQNYFAQNQELLAGNTVIIPILHQTLLGLSDTLQRSGTALDNKSKANAEMRIRLANSLMFRHKKTGKIVLCKKNYRPKNSTAYQRIEFDILETNNCINSWEKFTHTRNSDIEDARKLVDHAVGRLQLLQKAIPDSHAKNLGLVIEFLQSANHSFFTPFKIPSPEVKNALTSVSEYLRKGYSPDNLQIGKNLALSLQAAVELKCTTHETWLGSLRRKISNIPIIGRPISAVMGLVGHLVKVFIPPVWMHWLKSSSTCRKSVYKSVYERLLTQSLGGQVMGGCMSGVDRAGEISQQCLAQERMFEREGRIVAYTDSPEEKNRFLTKYGSTVGKHILAGVMLGSEVTSDGGMRPPKSTAGLMCDRGRENGGGETREEQALSKLGYKPTRHCKESKKPFFSRLLELGKKVLAFCGLREKEPSAFQNFVAEIQTAKAVPRVAMSTNSHSRVVAEVRNDGYQIVATQELDRVLQSSVQSEPIPESVAVVTSVPAVTTSTIPTGAAVSSPSVQVTVVQVANAAFHGAISVTTVAALMGVPVLAVGAALVGLGSIALKAMAAQNAEKAAHNSTVAAQSLTKAGFFASNVGINGYSKLPKENVPGVSFRDNVNTDDHGVGLVRSLATVLWGGLIFCGYHLFGSLFS